MSTQEIQLLGFGETGRPEFLDYVTDYERKISAKHSKVSSVYALPRTIECRNVFRRPGPGPRPPGPYDQDQGQNLFSPYVGGAPHSQGPFPNRTKRVLRNARQVTLLRIAASLPFVVRRPVGPCQRSTRETSVTHCPAARAAEQQREFVRAAAIACSKHSSKR